jgi:hypothetical protein
MEKCQLSLEIDNSDYTIPLGAEVWLDQDCLLNLEHVDQCYPVTHEFDDTPAEHELRVVLKNKTSKHTELDNNGVIVKDARIFIKAVKFDNIDLGTIMSDKSTYTHDHNGTTDPVEQKFYDEMGCNGVVTLKFTTPMYQWLLENM